MKLCLRQDYERGHAMDGMEASSKTCLGVLKKADPMSKVVFAMTIGLPQISRLACFS